MAMNNRICRTFTLASSAVFYEVYTDLLRSISTDWGSVSGIIMQAYSQNDGTITLHDSSKDATSPGNEMFATFSYSEQSTFNNIMTTGLYLKGSANNLKIQISARRS